jgi:hypothetical protein
LQNDQKEKRGVDCHFVKYCLIETNFGFGY